ncbi:hypothetical protein KRR40_09795 [Niabella defluvii]|nr:hypothetical protein KRR40_09795 [Niabella sp. I65]
MPSREYLVDRLNKLQSEANAGKPVGKPGYWGGYRVQPLSIEFWQGRLTGYTTGCFIHCRQMGVENRKTIALTGLTGWSVNWFEG